MSQNRAIRLSQLRRKSGLTLREVSEKIGLSHGRIDAYESDSSIKIKRHILDALASLYHTTVDFIEEGIEPEGADTQSREINIAEIDRLNDRQIKRLRIPIIPLSVSATFLENVDGSFVYDWKELSNLEQESVVKEPGVRYDGKTVVFKVINYSMYPVIKPGCRILCTWVEDGNWQYAQGVHVLSLRTGMLIVKRVRKYEEGRLLLVSDNPDHGEMWVGLNDVIAIWKAEYKTYELIE